MSNPEVENYEELCRLCASYDAIKMDIFSDKGKKRRLVDKITTCLPFEVSEDDLYPKSLCYRCIYNLETFYDFRRGCIAAKAKLETVIKRANEKISRDKVESNDVAGKVRGFSTNHLQENEEGIIVSDDEQQPNPADFLEACLGESPHHSVGAKQDEEWGPFCCKTCGRMFNSRSALTIHAKFHQEKSDAEREVFSCFVCEKVFSSKGHLALHSRVHIGETNSPMLANSRGASPQIKLYRCDLCSKSYSMAKHLWGHVSTCHKGDPLVTCALCMRTFSSISNLEDHRKVKHKDEIIERPIKPPPPPPPPLPQHPQLENVKIPNELVVTIAGGDDSSETKNQEENTTSNKRKSTKPRKIERELTGPAGEADDLQRMNQDGLVYSCLVCGERFIDPQKLREHVHSAHGYEEPLDFDNLRDYGENEYVDSMMEAETVFCCEICIREFNDRASLWLHMLYSHREEASKACGICLKICGDTENLAQHVESCHPRNKTDQRRYSCQVCARQHDSRKKLVTHAKIHKLTDSLGNLVDPETVVVLNSDYYPQDMVGGQPGMLPMQTDDNNFLSSCEICFKVFENEAKLSKHKRTAHKDLNSSNNASPYHFFFACELCGLSHLSRSERWRHMVLLHSGDPAVTCQQQECGKVFPTSAVKREHEETHHAIQGQYPNTCEVCGKMWKTRVEYWKHMMGVHPDYLPFVCGVCLKVFTELSPLVNHVRSTHWPLLGGDFCCDICGRPYSKVSKMSRHRKVHYVPTNCPEMRAILDNPKIEGVAGTIKVGNDRHFLQNDFPALCCDLCQNVEERVEFANLEELGKHRFEKHNVMPCDLCPKYYGRTSHLWKHVNKIHKGHPDVTCPVCHRTSASKSHLATHIAKHHKSSADTDCYERGENGVTKCSKCKKVFRKESLVRKHVKHCKGPRPEPMALPPPVDGMYTCERCNKTFTAENLLYKHMRSSHIMYKCELCQAKKSSKADLYNHVKEEHGDHPNVRCAIRDCTQILRCKADLDRHVRDHRQNSQLHICIFCAELVTSKFKLKRHLKSIHAQESKFLCFLCLKPLASFEELRAHIVSAHAAALERPNTCPICAKPCSSKSKMMEHIKYHGPTFHPCRICLKILPSRTELESHLNNHPTDSGDEDDLQIDEAALDPDSIMDIIGAPTDVKVKRNIEEEEEEEENQTEGEPPNKKLKIEYPCDRCEASFTTDSELAEHCKSAHKDDSNKTSILESVLSEGKQPRIKQEDVEIIESRQENGVSSSSGKTESDKNFMHQLGLMPDTTDKSSITPISKIKIVRKVYINDDTPSKCEMCGKEWPAKRHLWQHLIRYHRSEASTTCGVCLKYCSSYARLSVHLVMEHPDIFDGDGTNLSCKVCGKYHNARSKLLNHASVHGTEEERAQASYHCCLICESTFHAFPQLASHMEVEHKKEMVQDKVRKPPQPPKGTEKLPFFSCEICSLVFASGIGLANHRRIHEHSDRFKCGQCGEVCTTADALTSHKLQRHQGAEFVCADCKAQFSTYSQLTEHNRKCKAKARHFSETANSELVVSPEDEDEGENDVEEEVDEDEDVDAEEEVEEDDDEEDNSDIDEKSKDVESSLEGETEDIEDVGETKSGDEEEEEEEDEENENEDVEDDEVGDDEPAEGDEDEEGDGDGEEVDGENDVENEEGEAEDGEAEDVENDGEEGEEMEVEEEDEDDEDVEEEVGDDEEGARTITEDQKEVKAIEAYMCEDNMVEVVQVDLSDDGSSSKPIDN